MACNVGQVSMMRAEHIPMSGGIGWSRDEEDVDEEEADGCCCCLTAGDEWMGSVGEQASPPPGWRLCCCPWPSVPASLPAVCYVNTHH